MATISSAISSMLGMSAWVKVVEHFSHGAFGAKSGGEGGAEFGRVAHGADFLFYFRAKALSFFVVYEMWFHEASLFPLSYRKRADLTIDA